MQPPLDQWQALFNAGDLHAAHDVLEEFWQEYRGEDRQYYQALIQLTVAIYLKQEGRDAGAIKVLARAANNLQQKQSQLSQALCEAAEAYILGTGAIPQILLLDSEINT